MATHYFVQRLYHNTPVLTTLSSQRLSHNYSFITTLHKLNAISCPQNVFFKRFPHITSCYALKIVITTTYHIIFFFHISSCCSKQLLSTQQFTDEFVNGYFFLRLKTNQDAKQCEVLLKLPITLCICHVSEYNGNVSYVYA